MQLNYLYKSVNSQLTKVSLFLPEITRIKGRTIDESNIKRALSFHTWGLLTLTEHPVHLHHWTTKPKTLIFSSPQLPCTFSPCSFAFFSLLNLLLMISIMIMKVFYVNNSYTAHSRAETRMAAALTIPHSKWTLATVYQWNLDSDRSPSKGKTSLLATAWCLPGLDEQNLNKNARMPNYYCCLSPFLKRKKNTHTHMRWRYATEKEVLV